MTLLSQIQDSADQAAWRSFVDLYSPLILRYCRRRGLQEADARDVVQDVLVRVSRSITTFEYDAERGRFRGWLGLIIHQQILRFHSKQKRMEHGIGEGVGDDLCDSVSGAVDAAWVDDFNAHIYRCACDNIRGEFDAVTWTTFVLLWEQGRRPRDVALELQRSMNSVYQAKFHVLRRLREEVWRLSADAAVFDPGL